MADIKPIETEYNGYRFRSRLEARWAVFFDVMGIRYEYEPEGFQLSDGTRYLPDFYLPDDKYYIEVKGKNDHLVSDLERIEQFVLEKHAAVMILSQVPYSFESKGLYFFPIIYFAARSGGRTEKCHACFMETDNNEPYIQDDFYMGAHAYFNYTRHLRGGESEDSKNEFAYRQIQPLLADKCDIDGAARACFDFSTIQKAILKARQARFEHGETPRI